MKTAVTVLGFMVLTYCGWVVAQDLPPDILADQYLLEAAKAMEQGDAQAALRAFGKIEALDVELPLEFLYFYGKLLVENSTSLDDVLKGQSLLKQYVLSIEKGSEHYTSALELLSLAESNIEDIPRRLKQEEERKEKARKKEERKRRVRQCKNRCDNSTLTPGVPCRQGERCRCKYYPSGHEERRKARRRWLSECRSACSTYNGDFGHARNYARRHCHRQ